MEQCSDRSLHALLSGGENHVATEPAEDVARAAGVSEKTVYRLIRKLDPGSEP